MKPYVGGPRHVRPGPVPRTPVETVLFHVGGWIAGLTIFATVCIILGARLAAMLNTLP